MAVKCAVWELFQTCCLVATSQPGLSCKMGRLDFAREEQTFRRQLRALCLGGRRRNESLSDASFQVDDFEHDEQRNGRLNCRFQIFVYPCGSRDGSTACERAHISKGATPHWRLSFRHATIRCARRGAWNWNREVGCSELAWRCHLRPCTGYQKAASECASHLDTQPYNCYYVPGNIRAGVSSKSFECPIFSGFFALLVSLILMGCAHDTVKQVVSHAYRDGLASLVAPILAVCVISVIAASLLDPPSSGGWSAPRAFEGDSWGTVFQEATPWQESVETHPWREMIRILGSLLGTYIVSLLLLIAWNRIYRGARSQGTHHVRRDQLNAEFDAPAE